MRAIIVLVALVATPFLAGVAQDQSGDMGLGHDAEHCAMRAALHPDKDINKCDDPPPAGAEIHGTVFHDINGDGLQDPTIDFGIPSWFVMLVGTTVPVVQTDANGNYAFTGLSAGAYTVCAQQRSFEIQTAPQGSQCSGLVGGVGGYTIVVTDGQIVNGQDFGFFF
jgi:hypothetical protein